MENDIFRTFKTMQELQDWIELMSGSEKALAYLVAMVTINTINHINAEESKDAD